MASSAIPDIPSAVSYIVPSGSALGAINNQPRVYLVSPQKPWVDLYMYNEAIQHTLGCQEVGIVEMGQFQNGCLCVRYRSSSKIATAE